MKYVLIFVIKKFHFSLNKKAAQILSHQRFTLPLSFLHFLKIENGMATFFE